MRREKGYTQETFAERARLSLDWIREIESGKLNVTLRTLEGRQGARGGSRGIVRRTEVHRAEARQAPEETRQKLVGIVHVVGLVSLGRYAARNCAPTKEHTSGSPARTRRGTCEPAMAASTADKSTSHNRQRFVR